MSAASWVGRHKWLTALIVVLVIGWATSAGADADRARPESADTPSSSQVKAEPPAPEPSDSDESDEATPHRTHEPKPQHDHAERERSTPVPKPKPAPVATTFLVTRVIDGDTLELGNGETVRLVGIDTPEVGECGYDKATANLVSLVQGKQVRLTQSDEDRDRYGRLLRYVDIGDIDAGLRLIKNGLAIARYDSRDGYGYHHREPVYIAADEANPNIHCAPPAPVAAPAPQGGACAPGYIPCIPLYPPDVDCADVDGPISVTGTDPHGLDADGDGVACE